MGHVKTIRELFATEEQLDIYFPKGDKRRGEVLVLLGIIHAKVSEQNKLFVKKVLRKIRDSKKILKLQVPFIWDIIDEEYGAEE